jgi:hypothetical protein
MDDSATSQGNENLFAPPETPKHVQGTSETSTPPPSMDPTPQSATSSASVIDEV